MEMVRVIGAKSAYHEKRIKQVIYYCLMRGLSIDKPLAVIVNNCAKTDSAFGQCSCVKEGIVIELDIGLKGVDLTSVLCHELKHGEQYAKKTLQVKNKQFFWKGRRITESYAKCPAERAANRYAVKMAALFHPAKS